MAVAATNSWFTVLTSTGGTSRCSLTSHRLFSTSLRPSSFFIPKAASQHQNYNRKVLNKSSSSPPEKEAGKQKFSRRSKNEGPFANADGRSSTGETGRSQMTAIKSFGLQKKGKGVLLDSKDQQVRKITSSLHLFR
ncbi:hypothetical protein HAX54_045081 [Datura stramonium]|uniref:Uncharacterized protein n=1 Tax=Datura stramonium TaxID=4076 RepID=A0ABS8SQI1_DATST|nr:hypothetical protein [Datura stramonium]